MLNQLQGFRISPQQRHLWLLQQPEGAPYHVRGAVLIEGSLNPLTLKRATSHLIERHEILRTVFLRTPGMKVPLQVVTEESVFNWTEEDLSRLDGAQQRVHIERLSEEMGQVPYDLERGPMLRLVLLNLSMTKRVLLISLPALCSDAAGLENLVLELERAYEAVSQNKELSEGVTQYVDLAEWQNELFETEDAQTGREFWLNQNLSLPLMQRLPLEHQAATGIFQPRLVATKVRSDVVAGITAIAERRQTTVSVFMLACWQVLLWRYLEQQSMVIGTSFDGRNYEELEASLGLFAKYLPVQFKLAADTRFTDLLKESAKSLEEVSKWQESFTWEKVGAAAETITETPYFPFCFDYIEAERRHTVGNLTTLLYLTHACLDRFKLKLCVVRDDDSLAVELHYDSNLFDPEDISRLAGQFHELLESAVAQPDASINRLNIITDAERQQLLYEMSRTEMVYAHNLGVHQLFEEQVERTPDAVAAEFQEQHLSYAELNARANQIAHRLRALGVGPEAVVAICMERSLEMMAALFGILKAGGSYLPLDHSYPKQRLTFMLEDAEPAVLLTQSALRASLPTNVGQVFELDTERPSLDLESQSNPSSGTTGDNLAYIIYTSGSTGQPKGVMVQHRGLVNYLTWCLKNYAVAEGQGAPMHSPLTFDLTVTGLFAPLLAGRKVVLLSENQGMDSLSATLGAGDGFSFVKLTPAHLEALNQLLPTSKAAGCARVLIVGGEALYGENLEFWQRNAPATRIINEYGPTETVVGCCVYETTAADVKPGPVSIGHPIFNTQVYLLNSDLQPAPVGATAEIFIGGAGLARGYLKRAELTATRFIPHPFSTAAGARLYRTGDLGRYLPDGEIQFVGRVDHQVKLRGYRIELGEIEVALSAHPAVREIVAVIREDSAAEKRLVAYLVPVMPEWTPGVEELRGYAKERLPEYMIPAAFVWLEKLPLTAHGKVDREELPAPEQGKPELVATYVGPSSSTEEILVGMWAEVLGIERVGVNDNFFELGGHSLLATRIIAQVNQAFQVELPMHRLLEMPTVAGLAIAIVDSLALSTVNNEEAARVLAELEQLSDEEAEAMLADQSEQGSRIGLSTTQR